MQINRIGFNNTSFGISTPVQRTRTPYENGLDKLILNEYGKIYPIREPEDYERFVETTRDFKKGNDALLESCGVKFSCDDEDRLAYNHELDKLILEEFGSIYMVQKPEDCAKFMAAMDNFKKENSELLQKHFSIVA